MQAPAQWFNDFTQTHQQGFRSHSHLLDAVFLALQAEIGGAAYTSFLHTQNAGQCAALCAGDAACVAWTRVAGGRSDVRSCYLKNSLSGLSGVAGAPEAAVSMQQRAQVIAVALICKVDPGCVPVHNNIRGNVIRAAGGKSSACSNMARWSCVLLMGTVADYQHQPCVSSRARVQHLP